jgi:hypothetical protein
VASFFGASINQADALLHLVVQCDDFVLRQAQDGVVVIWQQNKFTAQRADGYGVQSYKLDLKVCSIPWRKLQREKRMKVKGQSVLGVR